MKYCTKHLSRASVLLLLMLVVLASGANDPIRILALTSDEVSSRIGEGEDALQLAFEAVLEAESAGANVSTLLAKLNMAGSNLTEAEMLYETGLLVEALSRAERCSTMANEVVVEAFAMKSSALVDARKSEWQVFTISTVGAVAFLAILISSWILFKRFFNKKVLEMKAEDSSGVETPRL